VPRHFFTGPGVVELGKPLLVLCQAAGGRSQRVHWPEGVQFNTARGFLMESGGSRVGAPAPNITR